MNTHKEPKYKVGDRVLYGNTEWDILSISKAGTFALVHATTGSRTIANESSLIPQGRSDFTCPHDNRTKGVSWCSVCEFIKSTASDPSLEPTPSSQIEEELDKAKVISGVFSLVNKLANKDTSMIGSEEYRAYHYFNALELLLHHYDPRHDIRWLEPLYEEMKEEIEAINKLTKEK